MILLKTAEALFIGLATTTAVKKQNKKQQQQQQQKKQSIMKNIMIRNSIRHKNNKT